MWWMCVVDVCGGCVWWMSVVDVCSGCVWWMCVIGGFIRVRVNK